MKKSKLIIIAAIGALVLLIGAGLARCAFAPHEDDSSEEQSQEVAEPEAPDEGGEENPQSQTAESDEPETTSAALTVNDYMNTRWTTEEGYELSLLDGAIIEKKGPEGFVTYFALQDATVKDGIYTLTILASEKTGEAGTQTIVNIDTTKQLPTITSDVFKGAKTYTRAQETPSAITIQAVTDDLNDYLSLTTDEIESALSTYVAENLPGATAISWTGEAYTDFFEESRITTFIANDPAATTISLVREADGTLSVL